MRDYCKRFTGELREMPIDYKFYWIEAVKTAFTDQILNSS
jgi:hypothetical protein